MLSRKLSGFLPALKFTLQGRNSLISPQLYNQPAARHNIWCTLQDLLYPQLASKLIFLWITHDLLPSSLVAQSVEPRSSVGRASVIKIRCSWVRILPSYRRVDHISLLGQYSVGNQVASFQHLNFYSKVLGFLYCNRSFLSWCEPHYESEAKCKAFHLKISIDCMVVFFCLERQWTAPKMSVHCIGASVHCDSRVQCLSVSLCHSCCVCTLVVARVRKLLLLFVVPFCRATAVPSWSLLSWHLSRRHDASCCDQLQLLPISRDSFRRTSCPSCTRPCGIALDGQPVWNLTQVHRTGHPLEDVHLPWAEHGRASVGVSGIRDAVFGRSRTSVLDTLSWQNVPKMRRRQRRWNWADEATFLSGISCPDFAAIE